LKQIRSELKAQQRQRFWLTLTVIAALGGTLTLVFESNVLLGGSLLAAGAVAAWFGRPNGST
jgi:hypothetical protein